MHTFIIAEMSANHCGDLRLAREIILKARECGADAVKLQTYTADTLTINCDSEIFLGDRDGLWAGRPLYELYQKAATPWEWQGELKAYADSLGLELFSTPFDRTAVDFLETLGVRRYKIASFEAFDYPLIRYAARLHKPMIISVGISTLEEIEEAVASCEAVGNHDITLLKCTSSYPAPLESLNLLTISDLISRFAPRGVAVGLSDHSLSLVPPVTAVALGARVIEKHFTLDRALGGEDCGFSLNPGEFKAMVQAVRDTEKALGKVDYTVSPASRHWGRSLFAVRDIRRGERFTSENVRSIRPASGLHPRLYEEVLSKRAARDIPFGTPLTLEMLAGGEV